MKDIRLRIEGGPLPKHMRVWITVPGQEEQEITHYLTGITFECGLGRVNQVKCDFVNTEIFSDLLIDDYNTNLKVSE